MVTDVELLRLHYYADNLRAWRSGVWKTATRQGDGAAFSVNPRGAIPAGRSAGQSRRR